MCKSEKQDVGHQPPSPSEVEESGWPLGEKVTALISEASEKKKQGPHWWPEWLRLCAHQGQGPGFDPGQELDVPCCNKRPMLQPSSLHVAMP